MMIKALTIFVYLLLVVSFTQGQQINPDQSYVTFEIGGIAWSTIKGEIKGMQGDVVFDTTRLSESRFEVCIDPGSINTDNNKRDDHLRSEDFFNVSQFIDLCFTSTAIKKAEQGYLAIGVLRMHGVEREIEIPFTYLNNTFIGTITINRFDYGLAADSYKKTFMVGETAQVQIVCVLK